ncbi:PTS sugar transporter subunit IIA [Reinekea marina]|uniref:PTS sugar transporter subunit IIA n=1 Tax=Reinekea marina TaxID=1310421 RepID=A0ABV7WRE7_9GAMM|nr:PTS sugar transporter subunit IIA [Reinekea marina]MBU2864440.1 PTS sugar transporter subunit IIA [Reinekea forsetii]MDN3647614.1 PTS sugar transporter subunit IIA [Reinekea marina]
MNNTLITPETVLLNLESDSKQDAIHRLCGHMFLNKLTSNPSELYDDIIARENIVSTFAGCQTAIPHAISNHVDQPVLCFARLGDQMITWDGDDEEVLFVLLLCAPATDDLKQLRKSQSYVFSSVAQLISQPDVLERWANADQPQTILTDLQNAFADHK